MILVAKRRTLLIFPISAKHVTSIWTSWIIISSTHSVRVTQVYLCCGQSWDYEWSTIMSRQLYCWCIWQRCASAWILQCHIKIIFQFSTGKRWANSCDIDRICICFGHVSRIHFKLLGSWDIGQPARVSTVWLTDLLARSPWRFTIMSEG